jgi:hypothetical protein
MSFLTQLAPESGAQLQAIMVKYLLPGGGKALKVLVGKGRVSVGVSPAECGVVWRGPHQVLQAHHRPERGLLSAVSVITGLCPAVS